MKKTLLLTLIYLFSLTSFSQSKADYINIMVEGGKTLIGTVDSVNGIVMENVFNENNQAIVYDFKLTKKETADIFRDYQSKQNLILVDKEQGSNGIGIMASKHKIIVKYNYYYNQRVIKSITLMPNDWGY